MAKRSPRNAGAPGVQAMTDFAEDLGRLLGSAQKKASDWLGQRQNVAKQLEQIRDTASDLLAQMIGIGTRSGRRRGRPAGGTKPAATTRARKGTKRKMSAAARKAISEAQKRRWAKTKAAKKSSS